MASTLGDFFGTDRIAFSERSTSSNTTRSVRSHQTASSCSEGVGASVGECATCGALVADPARPASSATNSTPLRARDDERCRHFAGA
jgi:hypothetical protein